jgi:cysteinyl-tRNA synthetase
MPLVLFDTARHGKFEFSSRDSREVRIYSCGPTVHARKHLNELRPYVVVDVLKRHLRAQGRAIRHVINITDVGHLTDDADAGEDKVERAARRSGTSVGETRERYTALFQRDLALLGVEPPSIWAKASEHVTEQIALIERLEARGLTYRTADGIYFDTARDPEYGRFLRAGAARIQPKLRLVGTDAKRRDSDFALWKLLPEGSRHTTSWKSPWGTGFPGWHVECSAMAHAHLGGEIDLHTGSVGHIHVHHENERAQSENAFPEKPWVRHWLHTQSVLVRAGAQVFDITVDDLVARKIAPRAYRLLLLGTHYRQKLVSSWEALVASAGAYRRLAELVSNLSSHTSRESRELATRVWRSFEQALDDDLNTPRALGVLWATLGHSLLAPAEKQALVLKMDAVLGLDLAERGALLGVERQRPFLTPPVMRLVEQRTAARVAGDFARADALRFELEQLGFTVEDDARGTRVRSRAAERQ